jgi:hypothetical protein
MEIRKFSMPGAPIGNSNAHKGKTWNDALRRAIASDQGARVLKAANRLLDEAANGQSWAIKELADRLDGKSKLDDTISEPIKFLQKRIQISFVKPTENNFINQ